MALADVAAAVAPLLRALLTASSKNLRSLIGTVIGRKGTAKLNEVSVVVLDESDEMLK
jgi:hypothetical protein